MSNQKVQYIPKQFEGKWIEEWEKNKVYKAPKNPAGKTKKYTLSMFPYPSGSGLHVGHVRVYTGTDVLARYFRMKGETVLHPMGWDAFGLPAENAAIKAKNNPMDLVPQNIANFKRQMKMLGLSYDWDRELATTDPNYYGITQWLFIQFYKLGLLYKKETPVYFCPVCKTGLAEEEVLPNGTHERCGNPITRKSLPQWLFRITSYADSLLEGLKGLDWPAGILEMQKNWIGRSEGIKFKEKVKDLDIEFEVYDSVPQTYIAQTFTVIAPEHPLVEKLVKGTKYEKEVIEFVERIKKKKLSKKFDAEKEIEGVFTGRYVKDPFGKGDLPIWVASFVLYEYGTGVVNCSVHDERDFAFAKKYNLPLRIAMLPKDKKMAEQVKNFEICYHHAEDGIIQEPSQFKGLTWKEARGSMIEYIEKMGLGKKAVTYHLRDWIFSRQRYWGEPIPMIYCQKCADSKISYWNLNRNKMLDDRNKEIGKDNQTNNKLDQKITERVEEVKDKLYGWFPLPENSLPLKLPYIKHYEPTGTGESPLSQVTDWVETKCPNCGGSARRETDTMPNWAGSCWYFLAFSFWNQEKAISNLIKNWKLEIKNYIKQWLPVDWYIGGAEHAVLHLLYARFWMHILNDIGLIDFREPFMRLRSVGMVLAEDHKKMSKSLGNVLNPDNVVEEYGADALRLYEMFMAPFSQEISWSTETLQGVYRFLTRIWQIYHNSAYITNNENDEDKNLVAKLQRTINKVSNDITNVKYNTAIAAMMEFLNEWEKSKQSNNLTMKQLGGNVGKNQNARKLSKPNAKKFLQVLSPFAPFITEEIWHEVFGEKDSINLSSWPAVDKSQLVQSEFIIPVQVNGKVRDTVKLSSSNLEKDTVVQKALESDKIKKWLEGKSYKMIYVEGKILNFVLKP